MSVSRRTPPEFIAGTLPYMAPEQTGRMNRSIDSRSDLYSTGVVLYEMLTGTLPFAASDPMERVHAHIARQPVPPPRTVEGHSGSGVRNRHTMMKWPMATLAGKKPNIDRVGLSYMLLGEARQGQDATPAKNPSQVKEWFYIGPMVMVVLPDSAKDALRGINQDLCDDQPYTSLLSSADVATPLWVIPVAKGSERIKAVPAK